MMVPGAGPVKLTATLLACVWMAGLFGCKNEATPPPARPLPEVQVLTVTPQTIPDEPEFIGQAEASRIVEIRSQVTGLIKERFFREGRDVKKGDRLYQIDPVPFKAAMLNAKAKVAQAQARVVQAKQNLDRVKPLLAEQAVSQKDVDDAVAEDLSAKGTLEAAKADLVKAQFDLDNTLITAPIDGLIERTRVYEGRLVSAQTDLLTIIHQVNPMYVNVSVPETYLLRRRKQLAAKQVQRPDIYQLTGIITFADGTTYPREGVLDFADVGMRTETGSLQGRFVFSNPAKVGPSDPEGTLLPGQFLKVRVKGYTMISALLVPQRAVQQGPKGPVLYVVGAGDKVEVRDVQATSWLGTQWLIEDGLRAGDRVVVNGLQKLAPGAPVKPVPYTEAKAPAAGQPTDTKPGDGK
jgi:membrane fusion protein (multidrug efflux system)